MRIKHYQQAALFSIAASTLSLADPINPLLYSDFSNYSPIHRRELECPADFFSCENQGAVFKGTCCENGQSDLYRSGTCGHDNGGFVREQFVLLVPIHTDIVLEPSRMHISHERLLEEL
ncbi:Uu.00g015740.m01.CDS01 [Anthostomella pinea]|uniref:Uu.00g015740.m01.CDS01 n=1 Tax=Anthostomella pinea TaxID=933095 RepID=A0AAI8VZH0_9PEZI|nr:Uu.00g015740.m01.CDS01 [Anthostomella pinea]